MMAKSAGPEIKSAWTKTDELPGQNTRSKSFSLPRVLDLASKSYGFEMPSSLRLGAPAVFGSYAVFGTEDPDAKVHLLTVLDTNFLQSATTDDPFVCFAQPSEVRSFSVFCLQLPVVAIPIQHIRDVRWLQASTIVCAAGKGLIQRWELKTRPAAKPNTITGSVPVRSSLQLQCLDAKVEPVHDDFIRELAVSPTSSELASGGFDKVLHVVELERDIKSERQIPVDEVISSVRWTKFFDGNSVSCTQDDGKLLVFDLRAPTASTAAVRIDTAKLDLYAHEHYSEHHMLAGFADGELKNFDLRRPSQELLSFREPYVDAIGSIVCRNGTFLVSGLGDVSVWRHNMGEMRIWGHMHHPDSANRNSPNDSLLAASATFLNDTTTITTNSTGHVELFLYDFTE